MTREKVTGLQEKLGGRIIIPEDPQYDAARKVHNGMIDKRPALIVYCKDVEDVKVCVNFARENNVLLAIRSGGHNAGGLGICDDGLVIDLSQMKKIQVNAAERTVWVQGGCLLKEVDTATHEVGMAVPSGIVGSTGVAGLTLGGGLGYLTRQYGLAIDNLLEAEVILANGNLVKASADENPDLFWALRGGGGNFGVVVSFLFKLHPVHTVYGGPMLWHIEDAQERMMWYHNFIMSAPDNIYGFFAFLTVPPSEPFPEHLHLKKMCGVVWCYTGKLEQADEVFKPIRSSKTPALDFVGPIEMPALQTMFDGLYPSGMHWYWKADFVTDLCETAIELHAKHANLLPTLLSGVHLYPINGAASRVSKDATAWNHRDANYALVTVGLDPDPANKELISNWAKEYWNALHPYSSGGAYVNFIMDEGEERIKEIYGGNYQRLAAIKSKYDPDNLFKVNQNIKPLKESTANV